MRRQMTWQKIAGAMLDEGFMAKAGPKTIHQEREDVYAALQYAGSFDCLVEDWKDCEELGPKPKEKCFFKSRARRRCTEQSGVRKEKVSMHEMWKRKQMHEDARKMCRTKVLVKKLGKRVKTTFERS